MSYSPQPTKAAVTEKTKTTTSYGLGKLRFQKTHGTLGITSLPTVLWALYMVHNLQEQQETRTRDEVMVWSPRPHPAIALFSVSLAVLSTAALAMSAIPLLKQVPVCTVISKTWNIIPPHKEAFRRTVAIVGYLDLRLANEIGKATMILRLTSASDDPQQQWIEDWQGWFAKALSLYYFYFFLPRGSFDNGNTWVFVVPMFVGFGVDVYHQQQPEQQVLLVEDSSSSILSWREWNNSVVTVEYLLWTLLSTQIVAFMFTLGFRHIVPIRYGYWMAALVVFMLCAGMGVNYYAASSVFLSSQS
uniref:Uncharacterized protein n=1 Tax=Entomoneis paludosa TaxID=265537 RepID=A0A7S3DS33_9STRA|mmetsp:Transcript_32061/g.66943  ORF Transcript_32061/g.66943 Transcript_32061/m.66943 type:complete len:302 (+) Transcript_32061:210-1115(+)|eukprot:CAMPEP_0172460848 /NCGR_PEP_ID=MMETSP1065-20121228/38563_1 /TAXON_ID=265537 /ORGANISM="Amphiprora paludosa, Strain CCMP125" /LENGTH=301 /DNA_ID=CAMNT_0013216003 /DNA_START=101 /DNA_END=1006 /DNA_ORIENTATION=+